jgi:hypothetical protein
MSRWKAAGIHLVLSILLALATLALLFWVWYPGPLFTASGGDRLVLLLVGIDIVIGPLLTLIVFRAGKSGMRFDLAFIGTCQVAALLYGLHVISAARPAYIAFSVDRFVAVAANQLDDADLAAAKDPYRGRSWTGPKWVAAVMPEDPKLQEDLMFSGLAGKDLERFPQYYAPIEGHRDAIIAKLRPLETLRAQGEREARAVDDALARAGIAGDQAGFLPLVARDTDLAAIVARADGRVLALVRADPWR